MIGFAPRPPARASAAGNANSTATQAAPRNSNAVIIVEQREEEEKQTTSVIRDALRYRQRVSRDARARVRERNSKGKWEKRRDMIAQENGNRLLSSCSPFSPFSPTRWTLLPHVLPGLSSDLSRKAGRRTSALDPPSLLEIESREKGVYRP